MARHDKFGLLFSAIVFLFSGAAEAKNSKYEVVIVKVDQTMGPKNGFNVIEDCLKNSICKGVVDASFAAGGINSRYVTTGIAILASTKKPDDETRELSIKLPDGYSYCHASIHTISVAPKTGDRSPTMEAMTTSNGVVVTTWTPKEQAGQGRSWVEAEYRLIGVRSALGNKGRRQCASFKPHQIIDCRGGEGINKEKPACAGVKTD